MQIYVLTSVEPQLFLSLPDDKIDATLHFAKVTAVTFVEREFSELTFDRDIHASELGDILDGVCARVSSSFDLAMKESGHPLIRGKLTWRSADNYELDLYSSGDTRNLSIQIH